MATSGGQPGNNNATKNKPYADALRRQAFKICEEGGPNQHTRLDRIANALFDAAELMDVSAIREIGDRIDGKVPQGISGSDEHGAFPIVVRFDYGRNQVDPPASEGS